MHLKKLSMDILLARSVTLGQSFQLSTFKHFSLNRTIKSKVWIVLNCDWTTKSWLWHKVLLLPISLFALLKSVSMLKKSKHYPHLHVVFQTETPTCTLQYEFCPRYHICQIDVEQLFDLKVLTLTGVLCLNAGPTSSHKKGPGFFPGIWNITWNVFTGSRTQLKLLLSFSITEKMVKIPGMEMVLEVLNWGCK